MYEAGKWCDIGLVPVARQGAGAFHKSQTPMLYPTVTELTRGTAHPDTQASELMLAAVSLGLESSVANTGPVSETAPAHSDLRRRPDAVLRLGRRDEGSAAGQHASHVSDLAQWRGLQAA
jgi:hypothetical protein